ncbi:hypothetical protein GIKK_70 [Gordonia phage GiKK]|nr:hypothetical protein GIKK_70 [Gordonia phage GiKK]WKW84861.1 hypothetical protein SEA_JAMZY_70 [Gordonia phage Jamzy]
MAWKPVSQCKRWVIDPLFVLLGIKVGWRAWLLHLQSFAEQQPVQNSSASRPTMSEYSEGGLLPKPIRDAVVKQAEDMLDGPIARMSRRRPKPRYSVRRIRCGRYRVYWRDPWGYWVPVHNAGSWQEAMDHANAEAQKDWDA